MQSKEQMLQDYLAALKARRGNWQNAGQQAQALAPVLASPPRAPRAVRMQGAGYRSSSVSGRPVVRVRPSTVKLDEIKKNISLIKQARKNQKRNDNKENEPKLPEEKRPVNVEAILDENNVMRLSVGIPDMDEAKPMDIVCVVDISASMSGSAACKTDGHTEYEDLGYSILDLVKHAVKTVVKSMRPQDRVSIVLFDDKIQIPYNFTQLDQQKRDEIIAYVDSIRQRNSTNIHEALKSGMDLILNRQADSKKNDAAIMFFTDGQPNCGISNPDRIVESIQNYKNEKNFNYPIHTYAFGQYRNCTSDLMFKVSKIFDGMFGYIQDAKTLGTIFINGIAYTLASAASSLELMVKIDGKKILPSHDWTESTSDKHMIKLPGLRYGQSADLLFDVSKHLTDSSELEVTLKIKSNGSEMAPMVRKVEIEKGQLQDSLDHQLRFKAIKLFHKILNEFKTKDVSLLQKETKQFVEELQALKSDSEFVEGLIDTVDRQVVQMLGKDKYMEKWGEHQLRHLIRSLEMQCKGNFREACLKDFGGKMFNELADAADDIYNSMDPPKPSLAVVNQVQTAQQFAAKMNNFDDNDSDYGHGYYGGGCFSGDNFIDMADGSSKLVKDLTKGDEIASLNGATATVKCVIRTSTLTGVTEMCTLPGGLVITHGHPVKLQGQWVYPKHVVARQPVPCDAYYNLVVDQGHTAIINGIEVILLGHGYTEGILKHEYLGTQRVIKDLEKMPGYDRGLVQLQQTQKGSKMKAELMQTGTAIAITV